MGPTSIMKPARMLPTWFEREMKRCQNVHLRRISPMRSCLSQLLQSAPPKVWQRYQRNNQCHPGPDFRYIVITNKPWRKLTMLQRKLAATMIQPHPPSGGGGGPSCASFFGWNSFSWGTTDWSGGPILHSFWSMSLFVTPKQTYTGSNELVLTSCFPSSPFVISVLFSSSAPPPILKSFLPLIRLQADCPHWPHWVWNHF